MKAVTFGQEKITKKSKYYIGIFFLFLFCSCAFFFAIKKVKKSNNTLFSNLEKEEVEIQVAPVEKSYEFYSILRKNSEKA